MNTGQTVTIGSARAARADRMRSMPAARMRSLLRPGALPGALPPAAWWVLVTLKLLPDSSYAWLSTQLR